MTLKAGEGVCDGASIEGINDGSESIGVNIFDGDGSGKAGNIVGANGDGIIDGFLVSNYGFWRKFPFNLCLLYHSIFSKGSNPLTPP